MTTLAEDFEAVASAHEQSITHAVIGEMGWRDGLVRLPGASVGAYAEVAWCDEHGVPVHRLPLAWGSTTTLVQLRSWLDGLAVGTEVER